MLRVEDFLKQLAVEDISGRSPRVCCLTFCRVPYFFRVVLANHALKQHRWKTRSSPIKGIRPFLTLSRLYRQLQPNVSVRCIVRWRWCRRRLWRHIHKRCVVCLVVDPSFLVHQLHINSLGPDAGAVSSFAVKILLLILLLEKLHFTAAVVPAHDANEDTNTKTDNGYGNGATKRKATATRATVAVTYMPGTS